MQSENRPHSQSAYKKYQVWYAELVSEDPETAQGYQTFNMAVRDTRGAHVDYALMHDEMVVCLTYSNIFASCCLLSNT